MKLLFTSTATSATTKPSPQDPRSKEKFPAQTTASLATNRLVSHKAIHRLRRFNLCNLWMALKHCGAPATGVVDVLHVAGSTIGLIFFNVASGTGRSWCRAVERVK